MFKAGCWKKLVFCVGVLLLLAGGICHLYIDEIFQHTVVKMLQLTPNAAHYEVWRKTPVPLQMRIYMFNWTNAEKFGVAGVKPNFLQLGPYTFTEHHEKVNITWNPNNTVSYRQIRRWQFDPSNSNGSLSDQVTTVDLLVATASYLARDWGYILQTSLSLILDTSGKRPHMTHTVGEMLFEGYEEPLIAVGSKLAFISKLNIPFDKFGWFYQRNGSASFEGTYSIATGVDDADNIGRLVEWNHANHTPFYPGQCGMVNGSAGEMWPPFRQKTHTIAAFVPDFCRSLSLDYAREQTVHGLRGYRYSAGARNFDDGTLYPDNKCFCGGKCVPSGVLNVSACRFGGPAFLSYPHFYKADPYYLQQVDGMEPDPDSHEYYVTLEPTTGIPLDVAVRLQINIKVDSHKYVRMFRNASTGYLPVMWLEGRGGMSAEMAPQVSSLVGLPHTLHLAFLSVLVLGALIIGLLCLLSVLGACGLPPSDPAPTNTLKRKLQSLDGSGKPPIHDLVANRDPVKLQRYQVTEHVPLVEESIS
ncbi:protein peste-like isoform X1 [Bacillus rossius redtenbacheri]|uniref:protein peste-like isoform X1 n=1 Tax=Bacillus rossius redtenbacheri TaxID=93214 RepID=UPI002FDEA0B8